MATFEIKDTQRIKKTEQKISYRINFALERRYKTKLPAANGPRANWVGEKYSTHRTTVWGWLYENRRPRAEKLKVIANDTGVDFDWLWYGGPNPHDGMPFQEAPKVDPTSKVQAYLKLNEVGEAHNFHYQFTDELFDIAANSLAVEHSREGEIREESVLSYGTLLNEISRLKGKYEN